MISIPTGFLSFAKLVMMSPTLQNLRGMPDTRPKIHSFVDRLSHTISTQLGVRCFYVVGNELVVLACFESFCLNSCGISKCLKPAKGQKHYNTPSS